MASQINLRRPIMSTGQDAGTHASVGHRTSGEAGATPGHETMAETGGSGGEGLTRNDAGIAGETTPGVENPAGPRGSVEAGDAGADSESDSGMRGAQDTRSNQADAVETGLGTPETGANQDESDIEGGGHA
jgi:hypothetical protein